MTVRPATRQAHETALEAEVTAIGIQTLVTGVAPITPAQRLAIRADAPLQARKPQRPADHGLFDTTARNQIEMF
jgi:predicted thioesterase